eukprot:s1426_g19.t1
MAVRHLLGLLRTPDPLEELHGDAAGSGGRREAMGAGQVPSDLALSALILAGNPGRRRWSGEADQEERKFPRRNGGLNPEAQVTEFGKGPFTFENDVDIETGALSMDDRFPPLPPALASPAEFQQLQKGTMGNSWSQSWAKLKGWMSPSKRPHRAPGAEVAEQPPSRKELPVIRKEVDSKDKLGKALASARVLKRRGLKSPSIENSFAAASSKDSKNAKKRTVQKILEVLAGKDQMPLTVDVLKGLATALSEGGYKAGEGYMVEAKLWHIEDGHKWTDALDRAFKQCKRALARGQGPRKKAAEVPAGLRENPNRLTFAQADKAVKFGKELFVFCVVWMLREIELANICTEDIMLDHTVRRVTLTLKMTKTDPEAKGVRRTLQCLCSGNNCEVECPFIVSQSLLGKVEKFNGTGSPVALTKAKILAKKADLVRTWKWLFGKDTSGHSGRRTGALQYIRSGWSVTQVAHLGRWKSSAILAYAEEALEQMPANLSVATPMMDSKGVPSLEKKWVDEEDLKKWKAQLRKEIEELKGNLEAQGEENEKTLEKWTALYKDAPGTLPQKIMSLPGKVVHWNLAKSAASPPLTWRTMCGWSYYGSNFTFVGADTDLTCQKCLGLCAKTQ